MDKKFGYMYHAITFVPTYHDVSILHFYDINQIIYLGIQKIMSSSDAHQVLILDRNYKSNIDQGGHDLISNIHLIFMIPTLAH